MADLRDAACAQCAVGVALPAYNGERFVAAALRSALAQSHPVGDVVVVDDGSDDASAAAARAVGPPVRVVRRPHAGVGAARSHAMSLVRGESTPRSCCRSSVSARE